MTGERPDLPESPPSGSAPDPDALDWEALERLRRGFLGGPGAGGPYWTGPGDLRAYDLTYGERIGWKWDAVLGELRRRGWSPPAGGPLLDWGCGSGVAGRRVLGAFGPGFADRLLLWDHSPLACSYAEEAAGAAFPGLGAATATAGFLESDEPVGLLVVSHVLNELDAGALERLLCLTGRARAVLWVEPGTHDISRALGAVRSRLSGDFRVAAPCTHAGPCPVLGPGNERHWCHHFAPAPAGIFADARWVRFGQRAGIDLRSLPYCFLALDRSGPAGSDPMPGWSRIIGRPERFKPYTRLLSCDGGGLSELSVAKRLDPALIKALDRERGPLVYRWERDGGNILRATPLPAPPAGEREG